MKDLGKIALIGVGAWIGLSYLSNMMNTLKSSAGGGILSGISGLIPSGNAGGTNPITNLFNLGNPNPTAPGGILAGGTVGGGSGFDFTQWLKDNLNAGSPGGQSPLAALIPGGGGATPAPAQPGPTQDSPTGIIQAIITALLTGAGVYGLVKGTQLASPLIKAGVSGVARGMDAIFSAKETATRTLGKGIAERALPRLLGETAGRGLSRLLPVVGWGLLAADVGADTARLFGVEGVPDWLGFSPIIGIFNKDFKMPVFKVPSILGDKMNTTPTIAANKGPYSMITAEQFNTLPGVPVSFPKGTTFSPEEGGYSLPKTPPTEWEKAYEHSVPGS